MQCAIKRKISELMFVYIPSRLTLLFKNLENMNSNGGQQGGQSVNPLGPNKNLAGVKLPGGL